MFHALHTHPLFVHAVPGDPPQDFMRTDASSTSITLTWASPTMPNGEITGYNLTINSQELAMLSPANFSFVAVNLSEATNFNFSIAAQTSVGQGPAASITVTTLEDGEDRVVCDT